MRAYPTRPRAASRRPINKVSAATLAAAVVQVLVWALDTYGGVPVPPAIVVVLTTIATFAAGYLVPLAPGEIVYEARGER